MALLRLVLFFLFIAPLASVKFFGLGSRGIGGVKEMPKNTRVALKRELDACRAKLNRLLTACERSNPLSPNKNPICKSSVQVQLKNIRFKCSILEGVYLVDTAVHKGDPIPTKSTGSPSSSRQKRAAAQIERRLNVLAESLKSTADEVGVDKGAPATQDHPRRQRGSCNLTPRSDHSTRAVRMGKTIETSVSGSVGVVITETRASGYVYGQYGEFGCLETRCSGLESDAGVAFGVAEGYYYRFNDVAGQSKLYVGSIGGQSVGYSFGYIYSLTTGRKIGYVSSYETAADYVPVSVGVFYCDTEVVRGNDCKVSTTYRTAFFRSLWRGGYYTRKVSTKVSNCG